MVIGFEIAVNSDDKIIFFFTKSDNGFLSRVMKNNSLFTVFKIFRNLALQRIDWQKFKTAALAADLLKFLPRLFCYFMKRCNNLCTNFCFTFCDTISPVKVLKGVFRMLFLKIRT